MRPSVHQYFLGMAHWVSTRSTCLRRRVGCVLVNHRNEVIATGYNGVAAGLTHCNDYVDETFIKVLDAYQRQKELLASGFLAEVDQFGGFEQADDADHIVRWWPHACKGAQSPSGVDLDLCQAIHAEQNALLQCRDVRDIKIVYCTTAPCVTCTKLLMSTSAEWIIFSEGYAHDDEAQKLWDLRQPGRWVRYDKKLPPDFSPI